ncbi:DUF2866 domain-containing protein [Robbsia sp. Bb-Pol-6]|uniref:DUF2866 domain-containing protein n=1 Tax=Robbsia betulipollinis TaxID=2981849 RepID=A0ABT3ZHW5_9BURK|nr:DUF2866 domain-containing protein [Robbsia betulipollinis]MCY0386052.1 DUF2866 domain-containing protein [Robbsia betulipollinis]
MSPEPIPLRSCQVSEPLMQLWGECCRIIEWTHPEGGSTRLAVPGSATPAQIEQQLRGHRAGLRYVANDGLAPSRGHVLLGY